jgi:hypothetical protein
MKIATLLTEAKMLFPDFHEIKLDPDRSDLHDITNQLMPLIVKMAYKDLWIDKEKHEQKYGPKSDDEDAYNFEFTESALVDKVEDMLSALAERLKDIRMADIKEEIKRSEKDFQDKLE